MQGGSLKMKEESAEKKCVKFQDETTIAITVVSRLSEARRIILAAREVVLLDRFQIKGKSVVMFPSGPPLQVFNETKEALLKMTDLTEINGDYKNKLLKVGPEVARGIVCYEVDNKFASIIRQIES
ncbi:MAG: hypothetical protein ACD_5C00060G0004, partial [uncultured bacterium]